jgi:hypothetical protein
VVETDAAENASAVVSVVSIFLTDSAIVISPIR